MKIIIAGGRDFNNYYLLEKKLDRIIGKRSNLEIVSGGAKGADYWGAFWAIERTLPVTEFKANWDKYGKSAGPIRNKKMAEYADALIAFWDGKSKGTENMIKLAKEYNLKIRVIKY